MKMNGHAKPVSDSPQALSNILDLHDLDMTGFNIAYQQEREYENWKKTRTASSQDDNKTKPQGDTCKQCSPTKEKLEQFGSRTTAHGWGQVANEHLTALKVLWAVITIGAYIGNGWHISLLVSQYLDYPTEQVARVLFSAIEFPSITICNIQPLSFSTGLEILNDRNSRLYYWTNLTDNFLVENDAQSLNLTEDQFEFLFNRLRQPIGYFENIGNETVIAGHKLEDLLLRCTFPNEPCDYSNFTFYENPSYFNCYTFNGGNVSANNLIAKSTGPSQGLSLIFYLESDNGDDLYNGTYHTLSNIGNAAGLRLVVHPPNTLPTPVSTGIDIPPGYSSSIGIKVSKTERLTPPYGDCRLDLTTFSEEYLYSQQGCLLLCEQRLVIDTCNCMSSSLPIPPDNNSFKFCGFFNDSDVQFFFDNLSCEAEVMQKFTTDDNLQDSCNCYPPCEENSYETDISYSYWPLDFAQTDFYKKYVLNHPNKENLKAFTNLQHINITDLIHNGLIRKNFARVNVYLKDLIVEEIIQRRTYELQNLFSDMGGTFGLWIGVSILSWFEIFEFLVKLTGYWCKRGYTKLMNGKQINPTSNTNEG